MKILPYTEANVKIVQEFLDETKERISNGATITFTKKSQDELTLLNIDHDITIEDIEAAIFHLTPSNYYRGIDPSKSADFNVCAFYTEIGLERVGIYLKYGFEVKGLQILIFSNHPPKYPMDQPFKD
ncbi:MAG: hypothetical protein AAFO96_20900 [Bacteroidota bacterium]